MCSLCCFSLIFVAFYLWSFIRRDISLILLWKTELHFCRSLKNSSPAWSSWRCCWNGCHHQYSWTNSPVETVEFFTVKSYLVTSLLKVEFLASPLEIVFYIHLFQVIIRLILGVPLVVLITSFCSSHGSQTWGKLSPDLSPAENANDPKGSVVILLEDDEDVRVEQQRVIDVNLSVCVWVLALKVCVCVCVRVLVFNLCDSSLLWLCLTLLLSLCSIRNASGLTAADLAYAQGFQECAEILSNAQNFQQNMTQSPNGVFLNGMTHSGSHTQSSFQGRSFLNGVTNRKRSFDDSEANPVKKARPNGMYSTQ